MIFSLSVQLCNYTNGAAQNKNTDIQKSFFLDYIPQKMKLSALITTINLPFQFRIISKTMNLVFFNF